MARVLVTGASGFIGSHVSRALKSAGHDVLATGRDAARLAPLSTLSIMTAATDITTGGLRDLVTGHDTVVHCAALSSPWGPRSAFWDINVHATECLLQAAQAEGIRRFVHLSSPSIYFKLADQFDISEDFSPPPRWINAYAESKWESELRVADARYSGMSRVILRPRAVFGEGDRAIFPRILALADRGWFPQIGAGSAPIDVTYVSNVADAVIAAMSLGNSGQPAVFNITNGEPMPVGELLSRLFASLNMKVRPVRVPRWTALALGTMAEGLAHVLPGRPEPRLSRYSLGVIGYAQTLDISRARNALGYQPRVSIDEGIRRFSRWWVARDTH